MDSVCLFSPLSPSTIHSSLPLSFPPFLFVIQSELKEAHTFFEDELDDMLDETDGYKLEVLAWK